MKARFENVAMCKTPSKHRNANLTVWNVINSKVGFFFSLTIHTGLEFDSGFALYHKKKLFPQSILGENDMKEMSINLGKWTWAP